MYERNLEARTKAAEDRIKAAGREAEDRLKNTIREANGAIKDLTRLIKEFHQIAPTVVEEAIKGEVERNMESLQTETAVAIKNASQAVIARFDKLSAELLGENRARVRRGDPSLPELVKAAAANKRNGKCD